MCVGNICRCEEDPSYEILHSQNRSFINEGFKVSSKEAEKRGGQAKDPNGIHSMVVITHCNIKICWVPSCRNLPFCFTVTGTFFAIFIDKKWFKISDYIAIFIALVSYYQLIL
ncbi:hypothetical protein CEXT_217221 [Caerostris extrusa]|uniref:Uncharacterized protein n=1 Tax=Caerostris extrusa TaxID=172846 RepID=A0AAV4UFF6_CAEEX|nr:hypothetical protein CEXT_217221 [Caerostris extrusa]